MRSRQYLPVRPPQREQPGSEDVVAAPEDLAAAEDIIRDIDDLLDEIDALLEEQAVLVNYRQRPGQ